MNLSPASPATPVPFAFTPSRRRVFGSHSEMCHVWASCDVEEGRSADGRMMFDEGALYSYGTHFKIAQFLPSSVDGRRVVLFTMARRSISTGKHINLAGRALHGLPVTVIHVPNLSAWDASPEQVAAVWESLVRETASGGRFGDDVTARTVAAFVALYAPAAVMPSDPAAWVSARDREIADAKVVARLSDALNVLRTETVDIVRGGWGAGGEASLATVDASFLANGETPSTAIERRLKAVRSALFIARKFIEHAAIAKAGAAYVKTWTAARDAWITAETADLIARQRTTRMAGVEECVTAHAVDGADASWRYQGEFLRNRIADAVTYGMGDAVVALTRAASLAAALDEIGEVGSPRRRAARAPITAADWQAGAGGANFYSGNIHDGRGTMVRRKGDTLETSRGAVVPFAHAVAAYVKASRCLRDGRTWHRNGDTLRIGHFQLDAIAADGSITVGCHTIDFREMERLACREIPDRVVARFPVPATI